MAGAEGFEPSALGFGVPGYQSAGPDQDRPGSQLVGKSRPRSLGKVLQMVLRRSAARERRGPESRQARGLASAPTLARSRRPLLPLGSAVIPPGQVDCAQADGRRGGHCLGWP